MSQRQEFIDIFARLKAILQKYEKRLCVKVDKSGSYSLDAPYSAGFGRALFFGAVQIKKNYVSYHLMSVYVFPDLLEDMSPALKKRMQGKSCFNFQKNDAGLFRELAQMTKRGFARYRQAKLV